MSSTTEMPKSEDVERIRKIFCFIHQSKKHRAENGAVSSREIFNCPFQDLPLERIDASLAFLVDIGELIEMKGRIFLPAPTRIISLGNEIGLLLSPERTDVLETRFKGIQITVLPNGARLIVLTESVRLSFRFQVYRTWLKLPAFSPKEKFEWLVHRHKDREHIDTKSVKHLAIRNGQARLQEKLEHNGYLLCRQSWDTGASLWFLGSVVNNKLYKHVYLDKGDYSLVYGLAAMNGDEVQVRIDEETKTISFGAYPPTFIRPLLIAFTIKRDNFTYQALTDEFLPLLKHVLNGINAKVIL